MPYKLIGTTIYTKATGRWKKKQHCHSVASAKRALKLLRGLENGTIKRSDIKKKKYVSKTKSSRKAKH